MSYYLSGLPPRTYCSRLLNFTISFFPPILQSCLSTVVAVAMSLLSMNYSLIVMIMVNCMSVFYFIIVSVVNDKDVQRLADLAEL